MKRPLTENDKERLREKERAHVCVFLCVCDNFVCFIFSEYIARRVHTLSFSHSLAELAHAARRLIFFRYIIVRKE